MTKKTISIFVAAALGNFLFSPEIAFAQTAESPAVPTLSAKDFGAIGNGVVDDRPALQRAIDKCSEKGCRLSIPNGQYMLSVVTDLGARHGIASLMMKSNVHIVGESRDGVVLKVAPKAYGAGAFFRAITSDDGSVLRNSSIANITVDGDRSHQTPGKQACNILIYASDGLTISQIRSINANGQAIQVVGSFSEPVRNLAIHDNEVSNASGIGIQVSQFDGINISNNNVSSVGGNGIDVYGDDGTTTSHGSNFLIADNHVVGSGDVGIFLETVRAGVARHNVVESTKSAGIAVNRIHGQPNNISIEGNSFSKVDVGLQVTGDTGGVTFANNSITGFETAGVQLGLGSGNASLVTVTGNRFYPDAARKPPIVQTAGPQVTRCKIDGNSVAVDDVASYPVLRRTAKVNDDVQATGFLQGR